jgi:hypothetical protein
MAAAVCVAIAAGFLTTILPTSTVTLRWVHSVEKVPWEEDYATTPDGLIITEARVVQSGAGMEPPQSARFDGTWWRYRPALAALPIVELANSEFAAGYQICWAGKCEELSQLVPKGRVAAIKSLPCTKTW